MVAILVILYIGHMILLVIDGVMDENLTRAYSELLHVTKHKARIRDRLRHSHRILRKVVWPVKVMFKCSSYLQFSRAVGDFFISSKNYTVCIHCKDKG